jgi:HEAT repeat protein
MVHAFERTGRWPDALDALHRPSPEAEAFGQAFRARLMTSAAWSADAAGTEAQVRLIAVQACSPTPLPVPAPAAGQVGPLPRVEPQAALQGLRAASESCQEDLEAGHIHALLAMVTGGMKREVEIFDRLIELLEMRLYVGRPEDAARLLPIMFGPALDDAARKRLRERVVRKLEDKYRAELVKHLTGEALSGSEAAGPPARVGAEVFGEAFWTLLFRGLCDDARRDPSAMVRHLAATFEKALSPMLMTAAKDPDPMRRLRAVELLAAFASDEARYVAAKAMEDPDENVRIAAIFTLGGGASTRAVERILAVASGENEKASQGERCAAIYALGRLREARAIPVCDAVLAQKGLFGRSKDIELKLCAAAGLRDIGTPESLAVLKQRVSSIKSSRLDTFLGKLSGRSGSEPPSS